MCKLLSETVPRSPLGVNTPRCFLQRKAKKSRNKKYRDCRSWRAHEECPRTRVRAQARRRAGARAGARARDPYNPGLRDVHVTYWNVYNSPGWS